MNYEAVTEAEVSALYAIPDQDMPPTPQPPPPPPLPPPALAAATTNSLHAPNLQQPTAYYYPNFDPNSHLQPPPQPYPPVPAPLPPPPNTSYYSHSFPILPPGYFAHSPQSQPQPQPYPYMNMPSHHPHPPLPRMNHFYDAALHSLLGCRQDVRVHVPQRDENGLRGCETSPPGSARQVWHGSRVQMYVPLMKPTTRKLERETHNR